MKNNWQLLGIITLILVSSCSKNSNSTKFNSTLYNQIAHELRVLSEKYNDQLYIKEIL
jgi:hypothetical protein